MKKSFAIIVSIIFVLSSCTEYLDVKPRGYDIASKVEHYEGLLYGGDMVLMDISFPYMCMECYTDDEGYANAYSTAGTITCNGYKWEKDIYREDQQAGEWNSFTTTLYNSNLVIAGIMDAVDGTEEEKKAVLAEARMQRAWCTFMMSQFFGDVPIITKASTMSNDFSLRSIAEVKDFVLKEMSEAVEDLKDVPEHYLRIFKPTGYGLFGKVLFMYGDYSEAEIQLRKCYDMLQAQSDVRLIDYQPLMDANGDIDYVVRPDSNTERLFYFMGMPRLWDCVYASMYNMLMYGIRNDMIERFFTDRHDCRLAFHSSVSTGVSLYKTYRPKETYAANMSNIVSNIGLDLSEVYTMYAECLARAGKTDEAAELLVKLRSSRMDEGHGTIPSDVVSSEDMVRFAFYERMREQLGFGTSWFDMKRLWNDPLFQDLKQLYVHTLGTETYTLTEDRLTMAYPPAVLSWHPEYKSK